MVVDHRKVLFQLWLECLHHSTLDVCELSVKSSWAFLHLIEVVLDLLYLVGLQGEVSFLFLLLTVILNLADQLLESVLIRLNGLIVLKEDLESVVLPLKEGERLSIFWFKMASKLVGHDVLRMIRAIIHSLHIVLADNHRYFLPLDLILILILVRIIILEVNRININIGSPILTGRIAWNNA